MIQLDPLADLRSYIEWLKSKEELVEVNNPLSPDLEIPALLRKLMYAGGPAVLLNKIEGYDGWRVAGNLFSSIRVIRQALSVEKLEDIGERLIPMQLIQPPLSLLEKMKATGELFRTSKYLPSKTSHADFESNILEKDDNPLEKIPFFRTWPKDGGKYATFPIVITRDPVLGVLNMGVYRMMILDGGRAVIHWQIHKRAAMAHSAALEKGVDELPVAVVIGSDPGTMLAAVSPVPYPIDKALFAGVLRGRGIELYELPNSIPVPSNAEIVIEGKVQLRNLSSEGPFGDHWGYYDKPTEKYPIFSVDRVYFRDNPIYYGSVTGLPVLEDGVIGKAIERIFKPIMKLLLPEIVEVNYPPEGVFQGMLIVSIKKRYPGQAKKVMSALWGLGQSSLTKIIIVVDDDVDPRDIGKVIWAISSNVNPSRDILIIGNSHSDALDPANISPSYGGKLGIDATRKLPEENYGREWPEMVKEDEAVLAKISGILGTILKGWNKIERFY
ncbi:MAG: UbiD family decarboxylase [Fervidicoccaceae archaeon]